MKPKKRVKEQKHSKWICSGCGKDISLLNANLHGKNLYCPSCSQILIRKEFKKEDADLEKLLCESHTYKCKKCGKTVLIYPSSFYLRAALCDGGFIDFRDLKIWMGITKCPYCYGKLKKVWPKGKERFNDKYDSIKVKLD